MKKVIYALMFLAIASLVNSQWIPLGGSLGGDIEKLALFNSNIYAGGTASIFRSTNNGNNWTSHLSGPVYAWSIAVSGSNIYCGLCIYGSMTLGVYKSTNDGMNWSLIGLNNNHISDLVADGQQIIANAYIEDKIYKSTDGGLNWVDIKGSLNYGVYKLAISENRIYGGGQGLHVTTDNGAHWNDIFMGIDNVESISANNALIFVGTYQKGVYRSSDYGQTWYRTLNLNKKIGSVYQYGTNVFAGADTGFYVSTDNGLSFTDKTQGLGPAKISSIIIQNNYIFVSNSRYSSTNISAWRRPLSEIIGIQNISTEIPSSYSLQQNYPNPFNPSTNIRFQIKDSRFITLKVFDILGKEVATLVNEKLTPGTYEVDWNASQYPSGVYFYKLQSGDFVDTKRMILLK